MIARRKWRTAYPGSTEVDEFPTGQAAYDWVGSLRQTYKLSLRPPSALWDPIPNPTVSLVVEVDDGRGWQAYEHIDFAEEDPS